MQKFSLSTLTLRGQREPGSLVSFLSKGALERMMDLAKGLLVVDDDKLDADPMLFNTLSGTIDLRTGELEKHDSRDLITKVAPVHADPNAKCPRFKRFLQQVTGGDMTDAVHSKVHPATRSQGICLSRYYFSYTGQATPANRP